VSLVDFIQKIQRKPRYVRIQILWLAVFICMFFIVSLWLVSLKHSLPTVTQKTETMEEISQPLEEAKKEIPSLKEAFKASIGAFFEKDLGEELEELSNQIENKENIDQAQKEPEKIKPAKLPLAE
jgi:predicted PurR-regulated permease PerM